ncbi:MAG: hypothetical protein Q7S59_11840 [Sulfurimonas sp.]|nr:hypothetical protein [Sulfurimonas sp.]
MSHKHKAKLEKLFEHPASGNIDEKRVLSAMEHYGVHVDSSKQNKAKLSMNGHEYVLTLSHGNDLSKDAIVHLRHFLESVDLIPSKL